MSWKHADVHRHVGDISTAEIVSARVLMSSAAELRALQGWAALFCWDASGRVGEEIKEKLNLKSAEDLLLCLPSRSCTVSDYEHGSTHSHVEAAQQQSELRRDESVVSEGRALVSLTAETNSAFVFVFDSGVGRCSGSVGLSHVHLWFSCSLQESETGSLKDFKWVSKWGTIYFQPHEQHQRRCVTITGWIVVNTVMFPGGEELLVTTDLFISGQEWKWCNEKNRLGQSLSQAFPIVPIFTYMLVLISLGGEKMNWRDWISIFCCWRITEGLFFFSWTCWTLQKSTRMKSTCCVRKNMNM